ncbi:uncharacterized protein LOC131242009 [Magnolia sinica]|uniref:uncharacterized protein LOC131242009 n=1 Tax=Magnolia sinica TaxID=86752 RepID=UPI0026599075|nr:uncharacterized protein LOC131242009 [Magnolia sinica]
MERGVAKLEMQKAAFLPSFQANTLEKPIFKEEIKVPVDSLRDKALGPNGFPLAFFQVFLNLVRKDVVRFIDEFFTSIQLPAQMVASLIALVSKKEEANCLKDFRQISLIGAPHKILAKILAIRFRSIIGHVISKVQGTFVEERPILDSALIAMSASMLIKRKAKKGSVYKLNIGKAYKHVESDILDYILGRIGCNSRWREWIQVCIGITSFLVLVNGSPKEFFKSSRGIRQGDPLLRFFFMEVADALSKMLDKGSPLPG